jgi:hypothetical protein
MNGSAPRVVAPVAAAAASQTNAAAPGAAQEAALDMLDASVQQMLAAELDSLIRRVRGAATGYDAPPFSATGLVEMLRENLEKLSPDVAMAMLERLRTTITEDLMNIETWKGIWFVLNYSIDMQANWLKRRLTGEYQTDDWGLDWDFVEAVRPFFEFMYNVYWRVETNGPVGSRISRQQGVPCW